MSDIERLYTVVTTTGSLTAASVTATTPGTANPIATTQRQTRKVVVAANLNTAVMTTIGGKDWRFIPAGAGITEEWVSQYIDKGTVVGAYVPGGGSAPTAGLIYVHLE